MRPGGRVLYKLILNHDSKNPRKQDRDRFLLSKGHACTATYSLLAELGYFKKKFLKEYSKDGSVLMSHVNSDVPGIEFSTGSLGHALPVGVGMAIASKNKNKKWRTFVLLSDGELNEGSNWEAFLLAAHLKLDNLIVIVDCNKLQGLGPTKNIIDMEPIEKKVDAFGWDVERVRGHDYHELFRAIKKLSGSKIKKPKLLIADTVKGKGISFMEHAVAWHYKPPSPEEYVKGLEELDKTFMLKKLK